MDKKNIKFDNTQTEKHQFYQHKSPISINDISINKIVVSNNVSFGTQGFKYFIGYEDVKKIRPLCIFLPNKKKRF